MWLQRSELQCSLVKVKAHRDKPQIDDPLERYRAIGNRMANDLANSSVRRLLPQVVCQFEEMAQDLEFRRKRLYDTFLLNVELQKFRAKHCAPSAAKKGAHFTTDEVLSDLSNWMPSIPIPLVSRYSTGFLQFSAWGERFTLRRVHSTAKWAFLGRNWVCHGCCFFNNVCQ